MGAAAAQHVEKFSVDTENEIYPSAC
jgi:hypothetical protein